MAAPMSGPPHESATNLWLTMDRTNLYVYAPNGFTNHVEVYSTDNLISRAFLNNTIAIREAIV